jgi:nucleoside-diphosphate-sugar epimerase
MTGASGFVGSHVLDALLDQSSADVKVTALLRNSTKLHRTDQRLVTVNFDLDKPEEDLYRRIGSPDVLIHLAWAGLPNYDQNYHFERELPNQYSFLKRLIEAGLPQVMVTGTCFEYGAIEGALSTSMHCAPPTNAYAFAKRSLHQQLIFLQASHPFILNWARLFYIYGDRQRYGSLYSALKRAAELGEPTFSMSLGEQLRDYLPVTTVASKLVDYALISVGTEIRNICSGQPISVRRIAEAWCAEYGWNLQLKLGDKPYSAHEPMAFWGIDA